MSKPLSHHVETFLFGSRWLQAPLYVGLVVAQGVYVFQFLRELVHLVGSAVSLTEIDIMLIVLGLIDVVMVANLLTMVTVGGYRGRLSPSSIPMVIRISPNGCRTSMPGC